MHGDPITVEGSELLARVFQHETDHLDGILFIDRLSEVNRKAAMKEIRDSEWFGVASENGLTPRIKISPHETFGAGF
jgi:peptide deformylase